MSYKCPLCGNMRLQDSLFCADCTKKVQTDYEVVLPEGVDTEINRNTNSVEDEIAAEPLKEELSFKTKTAKEIATEASKEISDGDKSITEEPVEENYYNKRENYRENKNKKGKKLLLAKTASLTSAAYLWIL